MVMVLKVSVDGGPETGDGAKDAAAATAMGEYGEEGVDRRGNIRSRLTIKSIIASTAPNSLRFDEYPRRWGATAPRSPGRSAATAVLTATGRIAFSTERGHAICAASHKFIAIT
jgi:hypothetical protein